MEFPTENHLNPVYPDFLQHVYLATNPANKRFNVKYFRQKTSQNLLIRTFVSLTLALACVLSFWSELLPFALDFMTNGSKDQKMLINLTLGTAL